MRGSRKPNHEGSTTPSETSRAPSSEVLSDTKSLRRVRILDDSDQSISIASPDEPVREPAEQAYQSGQPLLSPEGIHSLLDQHNQSHSNRASDEYTSESSPGLTQQNSRKKKPSLRTQDQYQKQNQTLDRDRNRGLDVVSFPGAGLVEPALLSTRVGLYEAQAQVESDPLAGTGYGMKFSDPLTEQQYNWYHSPFRLESLYQMAQLSIGITVPVLILSLVPPLDWVKIASAVAFLPFNVLVSLWMKKQLSQCERSLMINGQRSEENTLSNSSGVTNRQEDETVTNQTNIVSRTVKRVYSGDYRVWKYIQLTPPDKIDRFSICWFFFLLINSFLLLLKTGTKRGPFTYMIAMLSCVPPAIELSFLSVMASSIVTLVSFVLIYLIFGDTSSWITNVLSLCVACFSGCASGYNQSRNGRIQFVNLSLISSNLFGLIEAMQSTRIEMTSAMKYTMFIDRNLEDDFQIFTQVDSWLTIQLSTFVQCIASLRYLMPQFESDSQNSKDLLFLRSAVTVPLWALLFIYQIKFMGTKGRLYLTIFVSVVCMSFDFGILESLETVESRDFFPVFWRTHEALLTSLSVPFHISAPICLVSCIFQLYLVIDGYALFRDILFIQSLVILYMVIAYHSYRSNFHARLAFWVRKKKRINPSEPTSEQDMNAFYDSI